MRHIIGHFGDDLRSQSSDWCKKPVFLTNHLAGTSKTNMTVAKWQYRKSKQQ